MNNIKKLRKFFRSFMIDGYLVPKNDEYFNEYVSQSSDRLKFISNFSGSAGFAIILKNKNYLFVDGRYTIQGRIQSGKNFKIITMPQKIPKDVLRETIKILNNANNDPDGNYHMLFSKDGAQLLIMRNNKRITNNALRIRFKYLLWDGNNYGQFDEVLIENLNII